MFRKVLLCATAVTMSVVLACGKSSQAPTSPTSAAPTPDTGAAPDGATLKVTAPTPQSPINDEALTSSPFTLRASAATVKFGPSLALQYRFQMFNSGGQQVLDSGPIGSTSWEPPTGNLVGLQRYTWRVRGEYQGANGPWSSTASLITPTFGYVNDPLTNGVTVGEQHGGHFVPGQGWQADTLGDSIDYKIPTCDSCTVEFDVTNFGKGLGNPTDLKWISMGDYSFFNSGLTPFRDHLWKMHLEQRADGDGTGMKLIWRNGNGGGGDPGDHTWKVNTGPRWDGNAVYHFKFYWNPGYYSVSLNGDVVVDGSFARPYAPPNHVVELGCRPRGETLTGAIWRNVKIGPNN